MKPIQNTVITVTIFLFLFAITPHLDIAFRVIFALFTLGNVMLLYMVYAVLRFGVSPKQKFSEGFWYSDVKRKYSEDS